MIEFSVKMEAPSTPNLREHHMVRAKRVKKQRAAVARKMPKWAEGPLLVVRLTRVSPRALDDDNVRGAMKGIRDSVASCLRVDDASPLVRWEYAQAKGEPQVVVQIFREREDPADVVTELDSLLTAAKMRPYFHVRGCAGPPCACHALGRKPKHAVGSLDELASRLAAEEEARIPEQAAAELKRRGTPRPAHYPPRTKPVDAAKEAAETFAPSQVDLSEPPDRPHGLDDEECP